MSSQYSSLVLLTLFGALTVTGLNGQPCDSPLGFEDGSISDDQLTTSSSTSSFTASQARLNVGEGWVPAAGTDHHYLLVDLLAQFNITSYAVQGTVENFTLYYSNDRLTWTTYTGDTGSVILPGTEDSESVSTHRFNPAVKARYLAIQPLISGTALRVELYGCKHEHQESVKYTIIDDDIHDYQDWLIAGSPYVINTEIVINETARVRIHEGVKVVFNSSRAGINIYGTLEATGTDFRQPLPFAHAPNKWMGLVLFGQGTTLLNNCSISGASFGIFGAFGSMDVRNSRVFENNVGIHLTESANNNSTVLSNTTIEDNVMEGILLVDSDDSRSRTVLEACHVLNNGIGLRFQTSVTLFAKDSTFSFNKGHAISNVNSSEFTVSMVFDNCIFEENTRGLALVYDGSSSESSLNLTIWNTSFKRNKRFGLLTFIRNSPKVYHLSIKDSYIIENIESGMGIYLPEIGNGNALVDVMNNTFINVEGSHLPFFRFLIVVEGSTTSPVQANVTIEQNTFQKGTLMRLLGNNNTTYNINNNTFTTTETWTDYGVIVQGGEVHFEGNRFINCTTRVVIEAATPMSLYRNIFINPGAEFDLSVNSVQSKHDSEILNASFNYWGTEEPRSRIKDFFKDSDQMIVQLEPVFTTPELDEIGPDSIDFSQTGSAAGGMLVQNEVIGPHENLLVEKSIYVPKGLKLTLLEGVSLRFNTGTGIFVEGTLDARGDETNKVVMDSVSEVITWNGLRIDGTGSTFTHAVLHKFRSIMSRSVNPMSITFTHSVINDCHVAFYIKNSREFNLTLDDVQITNSDYWMNIDVSDESTTTVDIVNSLINTDVGMELFPLSRGHLNISIHHSIFNFLYKAFSLQSCSTALSLRVRHSSLTKRSRYTNTMDVMSSTLNLEVFGLDVNTKSPIVVELCPTTNNTTSNVVEIRDSQFNMEEVHPLNITTNGQGNFNSLAVMVVNNTFTTDLYRGLPSVVINTKATKGITVSDNQFHKFNLTIDSDAQFVHLKRNVFSGRDYTVAIHSVRDAEITLIGNELKQYGQLNVTEEVSTNTSVTDNIVRHPLANVSAGSVTMNMNTFKGSTISVDVSGDINITDNIVKYAFVNLTAGNINMTLNTLEDSTIEVDTKIDGDSAHRGSSSNKTQQGSESVPGAGQCSVAENIFEESRLIFSNPYSAIHRNKFYDINLEFKGYCFAEMTINCSHNFWDNHYVISSRILDSTENRNLPVIIYKPFYLYSNFTALQEDPRSPNKPFLSPNGTIGGSIGGHVTLTVNGSPYIVTEDIRVERLESLTLEAGVTLLFPRFASLTVFGKLRVLGNSSHPVYAKAKIDGQKWNGVILAETKIRATLTPWVRLVGECPEKEGRVEVKMEGVWRPVCGKDFDELEAKVVCRGLGYDPDKRHEILTGSMGLVLNATLGAVFNCEGREGSLLQCPMVVSNCTNQPTAYIRCYDKRLPKRGDVGNEVEINHFTINDTEAGLVVAGNVTGFNNVESSFTYYGITFKTNTLPSQISGIVVKNAKNTGIDFLDYGGVDHVELINCTLSNNHVGVGINRKINISFESCYFEGNEKAIRLRGAAVIAIRNSTFDMNQFVFESTATSSEGELSFSLINSVVSRSHDIDGDGIIQLRSSFTNMRTFEILNNNFSMNSGRFIYFSTYGSKNDSFVYIRNNSYVQNNASFLEIFSSLKQRLTIDVSNNVITENIHPHSLIQMDFEANSQEVESSVNFSGNILTDNEAASILVIDNYRSYHSRADIVNNRFIDNNCSTAIKVSSFEVKATSNLIINPEAQCELEYPEFRRNVDIDARLNYWGGSTIEFVSGRICGFHDDMSKGFVFYSPYYDSQTMEVAIGDTRQHFWTDSRQASGGLVESKIFLEKKGSPYTINRSIYIRNGGELHIASGVELMFKPDIGIYVDGTLVAQAEDQENIVFRRADNSPWFGVVFPLMLDEIKGTVRLIDHNERKEGRVEMCINGTWTRVCQVLYPDEELLCRAMGYESGRKRADAEQGRDENNNDSVVEDLGCKGSMWSLSQCQPAVVNNISTCSDVRVSCQNYIAVTSDHQGSYLDGVSILDSRVGLVISSQTVKVSNCYINNTLDAGITFKGVFIDIDLNGTIVEHGQSNGIYVEVEKYFDIRNGIIKKNIDKGMYVRTFLIKGNIEGMVFSDNHVGLQASGFTSGDRFLIINNNVFRGQDIGLVIYMSVHDSEGWINIIDNEFDDNDNSMNVELYGRAYYPLLRELHVQSNKFTSSGEIVFKFESPFSLFFDDNIARNVETDECFVSMDLLEFDNLSVSANEFENITAKCVVKVESSSSNKLKFEYNSVRRCNPGDAVVQLAFRDSSFSYNILENVTSPFFLKVLSPWEVTLNATNNWWDGQNEVEASSRLVDKFNSSMDVSISPVLTNLDFTCSKSVGCTNSGRCVAPENCRCKLGFTGEDCSEFDCSGVFNCSSYGSCVGPNQCSCLSGWEGFSCSIVSRDDIDLCPFTSTSTSPSSLSSTTTQVTIEKITQPDVSGADTTSTLIQHIIIISGLVSIFNVL